jgi:hypothetical protein
MRQVRFAPEDHTAAVAEAIDELVGTSPGVG